MGKAEKRKRNGSTGETAVRGCREEGKGKSGKLSSQKQAEAIDKKAESRRKRPEVKTEGKHSWNGCGSEARKGERKRTAKLSTKNREGRHGKPGRGERGKPRKRKRKRSTEEATVRRRQEDEGKEEQRLSSQNPKLKRTKERENSGGQKAERKRR